MGWTFDAGPLHFSDKGMGVRPQMKMGYADANVDFTAGLDDVRDGISGGVAGRVHRMYEAEGHNFQEVRCKHTASSALYAGCLQIMKRTSCCVHAPASTGMRSASFAVQYALF